MKEVIQISLNESWGYLTRALDGLTQEDITRAPAPDCNSLAFILWHVGRAEDLIVNRFIKHGSEIYETEGWWEMFGTPPAVQGYLGGAVGYDTGGTYTEEQDLKRYMQATHENTLAFLDAITPEELLKAPDPDHPQQTVGHILAHFITEIALHVGQIDYLSGVHRGLKRMNWQ